MIYGFEGFELDSARSELRDADAREDIAVEPKVFELLELLVRNPHRLVTRDEIVETLWGGRIVSENSIDNQIKAARKAIGDNGSEQRLIKTLRGRGVRFVGEVTKSEGMDRAPASDGAAEPTKRPTSKKTIAVLPFDTMSNGDEDKYLADGMVEDIITTLSKIPRLEVTARNTTFSYRGRSMDIRQVGGELGVSHVLEGSVRRSGDRLRTTAQLIDVETGNHLWAERYDREVEDTFAVQDEMTREIVSALQLQLTMGDLAILTRRGTKSFRAWDKTIQALYYIEDNRPEFVDKAESLLLEAIEEDDAYSQAHAYAAFVSWTRLSRGWCTDLFSEMAKLKARANKALEVGPDVSEANFASGVAHLLAGEFDKAIVAADRVVEINTGNVTAQAYSAYIYVYCNMWDFAEQLILRAKSGGRAFSGELPMLLSWIYVGRGDYEKAYSAAIEAIDLGASHYHSRITLVIACHELGKAHEAEIAREQIYELVPQFSIQYFLLMRPNKDAGVSAHFADCLKRAGFPQ